jgi:predicted nucleotidyltransferase
MQNRNRIAVPKGQIEEFCRRYGVRKLSFFGSVLRDDFGPGSDVDVLVEFEYGQKVGLLRIARMENELSRLFKRRVDLRTPGDLSRYFRQEVLDSAEIQYAKG